MKLDRINAFLWIGLMGAVMIGTSFMTDVYQAFLGNRGMWWTPQTLRLPIEETKDHFEIYICGESLQKHLSKGTLFGVDTQGAHYPIVSKDMTVRLNNWDKTQASILSRTTLSGFFFGISIGFLIIGWMRYFNRAK